MNHLTSLNEIFANLSNVGTYKDWTKERTIKVVLGSSVIKVFVEKTKPILAEKLKEVDVNAILNFQKQDEYDNWHDSETGKIYEALKSKADNIARINSNEGLKYGHGTKILNLFVGHLVFYSQYFTREEVEKVKYFLHVPLDSKVFKVLKKCHIENVPEWIKDVTRDVYKDIQEEIRDTARKFNLPPLFFDEYAWALDKKG